MEATTEYGVYENRAETREARPSIRRETPRMKREDTGRGRDIRQGRGRGTWPAQPARWNASALAG